MNIPAFHKTYGARTVLDFPGLTLESGKIYAIIGANGSGKTTFARILAGVLPADEGRLSCLRGIRVGYSPQKSYAYRMSVRANLALGGKDARRSQALMEALQIHQLADKPAQKLSGGETARMALARLMMGDYGVVILDEPTAAMDMESTSLAEEELVRYVARTGCTLILVTHSLRQAKRVADEVLFFHQGRLLEQGSAQALLTCPARAETRTFLEFYGS